LAGEVTMSDTVKRLLKEGKGSLEILRSVPRVTSSPKATAPAPAATKYRARWKSKTGKRHEEALSDQDAAELARALGVDLPP
jgi:hypothetical protein